MEPLVLGGEYQAKNVQMVPLASFLFLGVGFLDAGNYFV